MSAHGPNAVLFATRAVFLGDNTREQPIDFADSVEIRRLLLRRLEVLEAALLMLAKVQGAAATAPGNSNAIPEASEIQ
jgi:hypothetical protein